MYEHRIYVYNIISLSVSICIYIYTHWLNICICDILEASGTAYRQAASCTVVGLGVNYNLDGLVVKETISDICDNSMSGGWGPMRPIVLCM